MKHLHILNLGAGVQSSTLAMMFTRKELDPHPDYAIFADTQNESVDTYNWLKMLEGKVSFPINKVTKGNLIDDVYKTMNRKDGEKMVRGASIPFHVTKHDGKKGMTHRRCTSSYKIEIIENNRKLYIITEALIANQRQIQEDINAIESSLDTLLKYIKADK